MLGSLLLNLLLLLLMLLLLWRHVEVGGNQLLNIILIETDWSKVSAYIEEGGGGVRNGDGKLEEGSCLSVKGGDVGRLGYLRLSWLRQFIFEVNVIEHLQRVQIWVVTHPLACGRISKIELH